VTSKGAAHPNRPETAPPSDGGAVSAGAAAGAPVESGAAAGRPGDAVNDQAGKAAADRSTPSGKDDDANIATGDSTIDVEMTRTSTEDDAAGKNEASVDAEGTGATDAAKATDAAATESAGGGATDTDGKETDVQKGRTAEDIEAEGGDQLGDEEQPFDKELETLRGDLGELTRDLQRITAEYANYRKRVDRDRTLAAEQATGAVLTQLLPVLDDLDRARDHGDLVGPFGSVAEQLVTALTKFGLTAFGAPGDPFDPTLHEAVSHTSSPDVTETTCVEIMRRGYQLGERMLRPALVGVADPE
jgi:molecular chaperone GrpE